LVQFEERCRLLGESAPAAQFASAFEQVEQARGEISLTYFEFSTLAILRMMSEAELEVVILEVGLGGRLDAVNLVDAECAIITSIDLDHTALLGNDRETIGLEKAGIIRSGKSVVLSDPVPPQSIIQHAKDLGADLWLMGQDFNFSGDQLQWSWAGRGRRYSGLAYPALRGANQLLNASGVLAALEIMRPQLPVTAQAIRNGLAMVELTGRFQIVPGEPVLVLDVAHNPHSVAALAANLDAMGFYPCTHAVFGAMADKDLSSMLKKVLPMVDAWYFTDLPLPRASTAVQLEDQWRQMNTRSDVKASQHASPQKALDAAISAAGPTDRILVFGSFYTVGGVLQNGIPKLHAKHLSN
jgi:dihydrofolate synthase/folylpolyglutamate synthase